MTSNCQVKKIITETDRLELKHLFDSLPSRLAHQHYNLFDVDRRETRGRRCAAIDKIIKYAHQLGYELYNHIFIKYEKDSFTSIHQDEDTQSRLTIVTLVETQDLVGGDALILDKYYHKPRPSIKYARRLENESGPYNHNIIPTIVSARDGDSLIYNVNTPHAVTQVKQGHRIVLVTWFK